MTEILIHFIYFYRFIYNPEILFEYNLCLNVVIYVFLALPDLLL